MEAADAAGVASVVFFTTRFQPEPQAWIEEQARVGGWFTGRAQWLGAVFTSEDNPFAASPWRQEKGALWDVGPHALSVLLPVLGEPRRVTAAAYGPGDTVHLVLDHSGGASSSTTLSLTAPPAAAGAMTELRGESGVTVLPEARGADRGGRLRGATPVRRAVRLHRHPDPRQRGDAAAQRHPLRPFPCGPRRPRSRHPAECGRCAAYSARSGRLKRSLRTG